MYVNAFVKQWWREEMPEIGVNIAIERNIAIKQSSNDHKVAVHVATTIKTFQTVTVICLPIKVAWPVDCGTSVTSDAAALGSVASCLLAERILGLPLHSNAALRASVTSLRILSLLSSCALHFRLQAQRVPNDWHWVECVAIRLWV